MNNYQLDLLTDVSEKLDTLLNKIDVLLLVNEKLGLVVDNTRTMTIQDQSVFHLLKTFLLGKKFSKDIDYIVDLVNRRMEFVESKLDMLLAQARKSGVEFNYKTKEVDVSNSIFFQLIEKIND